MFDDGISLVNIVVVRLWTTCKSIVQISYVRGCRVSLLSLFHTGHPSGLRWWPTGTYSNMTIEHLSEQTVHWLCPVKSISCDKAVHAIIHFVFYNFTTKRPFQMSICLPEEQQKTANTPQTLTPQMRTPKNVAQNGRGGETSMHNDYCVINRMTGIRESLG